MSSANDCSRKAGAGMTTRPNIEAQQFSGYDLVEKSLPDSDHKLLARWVQKYRLTDDDPMFGMYLSAKVSFNSAAAAGRAAAAVDNGIRLIPDTIYQGTIQASNELAKIVESKGAQAGQAIVKAIGATGAQLKGDLEQILGASTASIRSAADSAAAQAQAARNNIIEAGVQEYRQLAAQAIEQQMEAWAVEKRTKAFIFGAAVMAFSCLATYFALDSLHFITPHQIALTKSGHRNCGYANIVDQGKQFVCVIDY